MNKYAELIIAGSFTMLDGYRCVNSNLVNAVAVLWCKEQRDVDPVVEGTDQSKDIYPL